MMMMMRGNKRLLFYFLMLYSHAITTLRVRVEEDSCASRIFVRHGSQAMRPPSHTYTQLLLLPFSILLQYILPAHLCMHTNVCGKSSSLTESAH
jgi:hypothetical protein